MADKKPRYTMWFNVAVPLKDARPFDTTAEKAAAKARPSPPHARPHTRSRCR